MISSAKHEGVVVPMITPVTPDGDLDEAAASAIASQLVAHGLHVFVLGTTGESASVPRAARLRLVEIAVHTAARRVRVYAGVSGNALADSIAAARGYFRAGVDAVVAHSPWFYGLSDDELERYFEQLSAGVGGPFMLYNIPSTSHHSVPVSVVARLAELPGVIGFKDSENTPGRLDAVAARLGGRPRFSLLMGTAAFSVPSLRRGYDGLVPSSANFAPALWRDLYAAARTGDWPLAEQLQARSDALGKILQQGRSLGGSLAALKAAAHLRGLCTPAMLSPLPSLGSAAVEHLRVDLAAAGFL